MAPRKPSCWLVACNNRLVWSFMLIAILAIVMVKFDCLRRFSGDDHSTRTVSFTDVVTRESYEEEPENTTALPPNGRSGVPLNECDGVTPGEPTGLTTSIERQISHAASIPPDTADEEPGSTARYMPGKGEICFWKGYAYEQEGRPYMKVTHDVNLEDVAHVMHKEWKMRSPRIVLVVISNVAPLQSWKNRRQLENFQKGLIKAANTTDMWILTNGTNIGIAKIIGDAVHDEQLRRQSLRCHKHPAQNVTSLPRLILVGVAREDMLVYGESLEGRSKVEIENEGNRIDDSKFELNTLHSHFLVVKDDTVNKTGINYFVLRLEQYLSNKFEATIRQDEPLGQSFNPEVCSLGGAEIPVVALLIQGGYDCARLVLEHLKKQLPVVVVRGSGGLADLLSFAYNEVRQREQGIWDAEFVESFLKPELSSKISHHFPKIRDNNLARNIFRDRILECVRYAHQHQLVYLTILNMHSYNCNLTNMDEYLLRALFKSQKAEHTSNWHAQMQKDLFLTMDWNSPHVAMSEVFLKDPSSKFRVGNDVFEQALLRAGREDFVALFLAHGFKIHKYLTPKRLKQLFQRVQNQEFFQLVCWEGVLGHGVASKIGKNFVESDLNWLIEHCTGLGGFVNAQDLSLNAMAMYVVDPVSAERTALTLLTLWAVFTNRGKMAKLLWRFSDQPIHLALVVSMAYDKLTTYIHEMSLRTEMKDLSRQFADMATGVLDACYREATCRAYDVLSEESADWKYKTAVDIAAAARNRTFLSHPCCQKWLTNMFQGDIRIREISWGVLTFPIWMKVLLCAFLIFPMYIWVRFKTDPKSWDNFKDVSELESDDERDEHDGEDVELIHDKSPDVPPNVGAGLMKARLASNLRRRGGGDHMTTLLRDREVFVRSPPPVWKMVVMMWTAPVTKFWTSQIFYIFYLGLFSVAVLWPSCGNWGLDVSVCVWTSLIVIEYIRRTYILYKKYTSVPLVFKCIEIMLIVTFVFLYVLSRILKLTVLLDPYSGKVLLCVGLLYFYYRLIAIYLPISPTLGPLLYRIKLMVLVDFINFMRMTLLVIISGGIVIHSVLYPDFPVSSELFRRTFHKAWFSLYLTPIEDLTLPTRCLRKIPNETRYDDCRVGRFADYTCPNTGLWPYIFSIQYFVLLKLILLTLLYALFSATASKLEPEIDAIWKFQRYQLVVDFANRLVLPAPLSMLSYIFIIWKYIFRILTYCCRKRDQPDGLGLHPGDISKVQRLSEKDYDFWRHLAQDYSNMLEAKELEAGIPKKQLEGIMNITEEVEYEKRVLRQLKGRVRELERMITHSHVYLETIKHLAEKGAEKGMLAQNVHILSRHSPYPQTRIQRFPVPDKYVPWEVMWIDYDPVAFTKPKSDFVGTLLEYVDEDVLLLKEKQNQKLPVYQWNSIARNAAGITIDRQSWMTENDGSVLIYKLEEGVPRNPLGRSGLRGRGALPRWGPNHNIFVIITRWQRSRVAIGGGKGLEFVVKHSGRRDQVQLPGGFVPGDLIYENIRALFKTVDQTIWKTSDAMIEFFKSCCIGNEDAVSVQEEEAGTSAAQQAPSNIKTEMIQRGYMDDPYNTDQAWREVELWHIHYLTLENLSEKMQPVLGWRLVTEDVFIKLPAGQAALLQEVTHRLQPAIL